VWLVVLRWRLGRNFDLLYNNTSSTGWLKVFYHFPLQKGHKAMKHNILIFGLLTLALTSGSLGWKGKISGTEEATLAPNNNLVFIPGGDRMMLYSNNPEQLIEEGKFVHLKQGFSFIPI
jgi:hypothetical protein